MSDLNLRYSKDGGRNWSGWRNIPMGEVGDFQQRLTAPHDFLSGTSFTPPNQTTANPYGTNGVVTATIAVKGP